jgi:integrase
MASRRGHGEGSIYRRRDGRWVGVVDLGYENGKRARKYIYGKTRPRVATRLIQVQRSRLEGLAVGDDRQTVSQFISTWLQSVRPSLRPRTWERYEQLMRCHVLPQLGHIRLTRLTPQHLERLYAELVDEGLSPTTVHHIHATIHHALRQGVRLGVVPRNVSDFADPPRARRYEIHPLSQAEVRTLLEAAHGGRLEALYVLAVSTGMRIGELLALRWSDVDLDRARLRVRGTLQRTRGVGSP